MAARLLWPVALLMAFLVGCTHSASPAASPPGASPRAASPVTGQSYQVCTQPARYLTSPWTYRALASGSRNYTVSQYEALPGYGRTLPPLPSYIASENPAAEAAIIYAPGSAVIQPPYAFPGKPLLYFFEGGAYGKLVLPDDIRRPVYWRIRRRLP